MEKKMMRDELRRYIANLLLLVGLVLFVVGFGACVQTGVTTGRVAAGCIGLALMGGCVLSNCM